MNFPEHRQTADKRTQPGDADKRVRPNDADKRTQPGAAGKGVRRRSPTPDSASPEATARQGDHAQTHKPAPDSASPEATTRQGDHALPRNSSARSPDALFDGHLREQEPRKPLPCPFPKIFPSQLHRDDVFFMALAYNQAVEAWKADETPIGAVIEYHGEVIAAAHNRVDASGDPTAHAEMLAITQAANRIGDWRLNECRLYVTKEPCPMCAGASIMARLKEVVFAVGDPKMGYLGGAIAAHTAAPGLNHRLSVRGGVMEPQCLELLQSYFRLKRQMGLEKKD